MRCLNDGKKLVALFLITTCFVLAQEDYRVVGESITGASEIGEMKGSVESHLELKSSSRELVKVFDWARRQAMAFAFEGDPVGPWYEAAEPGREAFCMRDVASQAMGGHALGLIPHTFNMLRHFAENISDARDWCSLWEIDRYNRPAPVDYKNDAEFWYNLPANFDILDCCYRMYLWSGNMAYVNDPVFMNFYDRTVDDYVERWGLGLEDVMKRPRLMNVRGMVVPEKKFQANRGIPGYNEQVRGFRIGFDVLSNQYDAYLAYASIQEVRGNEEQARKYFQKAADLKAFADSVWWNEAEGCYYRFLNADYQLEGNGGRWLGSRPDQAEDADAAIQRVLDLSHSRLEYPEISYNRISDIVNGTMGITLVAQSALLSEVEGFWVAVQVKTLSGLGSKIKWAELSHLPIRACEVTIRHEGNIRTIMTNEHGPAFLWLATFYGSHDTLLVNGRKMKALQGKDAYGRPVSWVRVSVGGGGTVGVEVEK